MPRCSIRLCSNNSTSSSYAKNGITFHRFPQDPDIKEIWINATKKDGWYPTHHHAICSKHFTPECFEILKGRRRIRKLAVPTLYLPPPAPEQKKQINLPILLPKPSMVTRSESRTVETCEVHLDPEMILKYGCDEEDDPLTTNNSAGEVEYEDNSYAHKRLKLEIKADEPKISTKQQNIKQIFNVKELLRILRQKRLISDDTKYILSDIAVHNIELFENYPEQNSTTNMRTIRCYSAEIRAFALTLHFYSPRAYSLARRIFNLRLPDPRGLYKWYQSSDGSPGFTIEAINVIKSKVIQSRSKIYATIIFQDMDIKSGIEYYDNKYYGQVDFGAYLEFDFQDKANGALVFLLVPMNTQWKIPFGYFLIQGLNSEQKTALLQQAVYLIEDIGVTVKAVVFDSCLTNLTMAKNLGCSFEVHCLNTTFKNPCNDSQIAVFFDPAHTIDLIKNAFHYYGYLIDKNEGKVFWEYIASLDNSKHMYNTIKASNFFTKNKTTSTDHGVHVFSSRISHALALFGKSTSMPEDVNNTVEFLKMMNNLYDILDSHYHGRSFKEPVNVNNANEVLGVLETAEDHLLNMYAEIMNRIIIQKIKTNRSPLLIGFIGLLVSINSAKFLIEELVKNPKCEIERLPFNKINMDHMEQLQQSLKFGSRNYPTVRQFEAAYDSFFKNIFTDDQVFQYVPSLTSSIDRINITTRSKDKVSLEYDSFVNNFVSNREFSDSLNDYLAGYTANSLIKMINCRVCIDALFDDECLGWHKKYGTHILLSASTTVKEICKRTESLVKRIMCGNIYTIRKYNSEYIIRSVLGSLIGYDFFPDIKYHQFEIEQTNHLVELAASVAKVYVDARLPVYMKTLKLINE